MKTGVGSRRVVGHSCCAVRWSTWLLDICVRLKGMKLRGCGKERNSERMR